MPKPNATELVKRYTNAAYIDITECDDPAEFALILAALRCYSECPIDKSACGTLSAPPS